MSVPLWRPITDGPRGQAIELAQEETLFTEGRAPDPVLDGRLPALRADAVEVFPEPRVHRLLLGLGQVRPAAGHAPGGRTGEG